MPTRYYNTTGEEGVIITVVVIIINIIVINYILTRVFTEKNSRTEHYESKHFPWTKDIKWLQIRRLEYIHNA